MSGIEDGGSMLLHIRDKYKFGISCEHAAVMLAIAWFDSSQKQA